MMAGVCDGDEVISTALTAEPTNISILLAGGTVVFADVDAKTGLLDPQSVRERITERTKAIMLVHYAGMVCDMDSFNKLSEERNIPIIEDNAHALGSRYDGRPVGSNSDYTCFSFQAIKHMTTVDGGMLALKSDEACAKARKLRWFGLDKKTPRLESDITEKGYKYHMNNVNAAIGITQLRHTPGVIARHTENGRYYDRALDGVAGVATIPYYPNTEPSYWLYTLRVEDRDGFIRRMAEAGVAASPLHLRNDRHSVFRGAADLPALDKYYREYVHIPCGWWVTDEDRERVAGVIKGGW
jgi:dTDP-4-amino-4,6-dideoxygalactose transaminase